MAVLLTCNVCMGATTYHDEQDGLSACSCQNGRIAVALPIADVLASASIADDTARHAFLLDCANRQGKVMHPLLFNLDGVPSRYQSPLRNNPSDAKRRIPLQ